jgi:hypothetical protein
MKTQVNPEELRREWVIEHWYEKVLFVLGVGYGLLFILLFMIGFIEGLMGV